jgi:hypothetical protein
VYIIIKTDFQVSSASGAQRGAIKITNSQSKMEFLHIIISLKLVLYKYRLQVGIAYNKGYCRQIRAARPKLTRLELSLHLHNRIRAAEKKQLPS